MTTDVVGASRLKDAESFSRQRQTLGISPNYVFLVSERSPNKRWGTICVVAANMDEALHTAALAAEEEGYTAEAGIVFLGFEA